MVDAPRRAGISGHAGQRCVYRSRGSRSILQVPNKAKDEPVLRVERDREVEFEFVGAWVGAVTLDDVDRAAEEEVYGGGFGFDAFGMVGVAGVDAGFGGKDWRNVIRNRLRRVADTGRLFSEARGSRSSSGDRKRWDSRPMIDLDYLPPVTSAHAWTEQ